MFNSRLMSNYTYFGAVCVLLGVSLMSFHMQIQDHIDRLIPCRKRPQLLPVKTENIDSTWKEVKIQHHIIIIFSWILWILLHYHCSWYCSKIYYLNNPSLLFLNTKCLNSIISKKKKLLDSKRARKSFFSTSHVIPHIRALVPCPGLTSEGLPKSDILFKKGPSKSDMIR